MLRIVPNSGKSSEVSSKHDLKMQRVGAKPIRKEVNHSVSYEIRTIPDVKALQRDPQKNI